MYTIPGIINKTRSKEINQTRKGQNVLISDFVSYYDQFLFCGTMTGH